MKTTVALLAAMIASASAFAPAAVGLPKSMAPSLRKPATTSLKMSFEIVDGTPFKLNIAPIGAFGFAGWVVPTILVPSNIPLYGGKVYISCLLPVFDNLSAGNLIVIHSCIVRKKILDMCRYCAHVRPYYGFSAWNTGVGNDVFGDMRRKEDMTRIF